MTTTPQAALLSAPNPLLKRCYTMSEPHLSGYRVVIGFERMEDAQDAHEYIAKLQATPPHAAQHSNRFSEFEGEPDHILKTDPDAFDAVAAGLKTHEIRKDDRGFKVGDKLLLKRTRYTGRQMHMSEDPYPLEYTGEEVRRVVSHIQLGYGLGAGWVILSFAATQAEPVQAPGKWEGAEEWMPLAWELCADECGEEACTELVWEGGPIPEPWGDRWLKYEDEAKRLIALIRKHVPAVAVQPAQAAADARDAFERWYVTHIREQIEMACTQQEITELREGDAYGDRAYLNGAWYGYQAALATHQQGGSK